MIDAQIDFSDNSNVRVDCQEGDRGANSTSSLHDTIGVYVNSALLILPFLLSRDLLYFCTP